MPAVNPQSLTTLARDNRGNVAIMFGVMGFVMMSSVGIAVDMGRSIHVESQLQNALDAAAIAALKVPVADRMSVGPAYFNMNLHSNYGVARNLSIESLPTGQVRATAEMEVGTTIIALLRGDAITVKGTATADPKTAAVTGDTSSGSSSAAAAGGRPCIHVMDQSNQKAWWLDSNSNLHADTCDVYVRSNRSQAMYGVSSSDVRFHRVRVKGQAVEVSGNITVTGAPNYIETDSMVGVVGDPYNRAISEVTRRITVGACNSANTGKVWTGTIAPGTYCGTTEFKNATFAANGLYIIATAPGNKSGLLKLSGLLNGSQGVSFYFADNKSMLLSYNAAEGSVLKAPSVASNVTHRGLLFFENSNRGAAWNVKIASCNKQSWEGIVYLPSANMTLDSLSEWPKLYISLAVNTLYMKSLSSTWEPFPWIPYYTSSEITYPNESTTTTTAGTVDNPIHLSR